MASTPSSPTGTGTAAEWERFKEIGNTHFKNGDYKKAAEAYGEGIKAKPDEAMLYSNRAAAYLKAREYEAALNDALRAVNLDPLFTKAFSRLHTAYQSLGKFKEGADRLELIITHLKSTPNGTTTYASTIAELQLSVRESREHVHKLAKARSLLQGNAHAEAETVLRPLFVSFPDSAAVVAAYAEAKAPTDADAANRCLMPFFASHDMDPYFLYVRALVSYHRGNDGFKNAQLILRQALSADPDHQAAKDLRKKMNRIETAKEAGNTFFKERKYTEAIQSYTDAISEDESNKRMGAVLRGNRSAAYVETKQYEKALIDVDFAVNNGNDTAKIHARRSRINENLEKWDEAVRDLQRAAELDSAYQQEARQMQAKAKKGKRKDFYKILGVERSAPEADIKRAYKRAALLWHPDKWANGSEEEKSIAENKFKELGEALAILGDAKKRSLYDSGALDNDTEGASGGMGGFGGMGGMGGGMGGMDMNDLLAAMMMGGMGGGMGMGGGRGGRRGRGGMGGGGMPSFFQFHQ